MKTTKILTLTTALLAMVVLFSCKKAKEEVTDGNNIITENALNSQNRGLLGDAGNCFECPNLILNESFENVTAPVPGAREHFRLGQVPSWLNAASTPDVFNQSGWPNFSPIPTGFDGSNFAFMGTLKYPDITNIKEEETIMQVIKTYNHKDIEYCLSYLDLRGSANGGASANQPGEILVHLAYGVPAYTGNNQQTAVDFMAYQGRVIARSTPSTTQWTSQSFTFKADKFYNRILFSPKVIEPVIINRSSLIYIDKIKLSCSTDALKDINAVFSGNVLNLNPVFVGLPSDVQILRYEWTIRNSANNLTSTQANPSLTINPASDSLQVCLKIVDSRGCCASICVKVINGCQSFACTDRFGVVTYVDSCYKCKLGNVPNEKNCSCEVECSITSSLHNIDYCLYDDNGLLKDAHLNGSATCTGGNSGAFVYTWYRNGVIIATTSNASLNLDNDDYIPAGQPGGPRAATPKYGGNGEYWFMVTNENCCPGKSSESNHRFVPCF
jgi:hypothetical protein